ncbi:MAG: NUDIX hydrolase [Campylobacterota bacterium]|nr:NUDIX hydrolase [Campylobacterota bacterium]
MIKTPYLTVDGIVEITLHGEFAGVVLIDRLNPPHGTALPGGFVDIGERVEEALKREMLEEIGVDVTISHLLGIYSDPERDSRFHTVSAVYIAQASSLPTAGDDASNARIIAIEELASLQYAFDHGKIIEDYLNYRDLATQHA